MFNTVGGTVSYADSKTQCAPIEKTFIASNSEETVMETYEASDEKTHRSSIEETIIASV